MAYDRTYLLTALLYAVVGMLLGIVMAVTRNHVQHVTHAHILLVGFVFSFVYAVVYRLWLRNAAGAVPAVQFAFHQLGALVMVIGLYLLYGSVLPLERLEPILALGSIAVLLAAALMLVLLARSGTSSSEA